jgi:hypothetical protein
MPASVSVFVACSDDVCGLEPFTSKKLGKFWPKSDICRILRFCLLGSKNDTGNATNGRHQWIELGPGPSKPPSIGPFGVIWGMFRQKHDFDSPFFRRFRGFSSQMVVKISTQYRQNIDTISTKTVLLSTLYRQFIDNLSTQNRDKGQDRARLPVIVHGEGH